jgi:hypothetical protein
MFDAVSVASGSLPYAFKASRRNIDAATCRGSVARELGGRNG